MKSFVSKIALYSTVICSVFSFEEGKATSMREIGVNENITDDDLARLNVAPWQAGSFNKDRARYFDLACSGDCDLTNVAPQLDITGGDIPKVVEVSQDTGTVIFSQPRPMGVIKTPKGHHALITINLLDLSPNNFPEGRKFLALGVRDMGRGTIDILHENNKSVTLENTTWENILELVPLVSKTDLSLSSGSYTEIEPGTEVSTCSDFNASKFDFSSVFRVEVDCGKATVNGLSMSRMGGNYREQFLAADADAVWERMSSWGTIDCDEDSVYDFFYAGGIFLTEYTKTNYSMSENRGGGWQKSDGLFNLCLGGLVYSCGNYVGIGIDGTIWTSGKETSWKKEDDITMLRDLCSSNGTVISSAAEVQGKLVAVTSNGWLLSSLGYRNWNATPVQALKDLCDVAMEDDENAIVDTLCYGNGTLIAVTDNGYVSASKDGGISWSKDPEQELSMLIDEGIYIRGVTFGNGRFFAVNYNGDLAVSIDGTRWVSADNIGLSEVTGLAYANYSLYAINTAGEVWRSPKEIVCVDTVFYH